MGNIKISVKEVLKKIKHQTRYREDLKEAFLPQEYKHITEARPYKDKLIVCVDSSSVLYELKLKKEDILKKLKEKNFPFKDLVFKIGA